MQRAGAAGIGAWAGPGADKDGKSDPVNKREVYIMATTAQVQSFIRQIAPLAVAEYRKGKKILPSVCIAQACCESAYGTSNKMARANAVFGIKVGKARCHFGSAWKDKAYSTRTKECYDGKTYTDITDMFRAYDSIADSVTDYYDMLCHCSRYKAAVGAGDYRSAITAIKNGGYATDPKYIDTICSIIRKYQLEQYDREETVSAGDQYPTLKKGCRGEYVKKLQQMLVCLGYAVAVDGIFGAKTLAAVRAFQKDNGLTVDGIVGKNTWKILLQEYT